MPRARRTKSTTDEPMNAIDLLLANLDQAYEKRSWHGANLRGALRGLSPAQAAWRPAPQRHCIGEHVLHAAYWKYTVRRRLNREERGSFPLPGSNWFPLPQPWNQAAWKRCLAILGDEHRQLRAAIAAVPTAALHRHVAGSQAVTVFALITGIAAHDLYHTGQIQLLKRLQA